MRPALSEPTMFHSRFEEAMASSKPTKFKSDPTTHFWTVYRGVIDEHDNDLVSKYVGDLDTSLLFVSTFMSLHIPFTSLASFCIRRVYSRLSHPRLLSKLSLDSSRILPTSQMSFSSEYCSKIPRSVESTRWHPSRISRSVSLVPNPSSSRACPLH